MHLCLNVLMESQEEEGKVWGWAEDVLQLFVEEGGQGDHPQEDVVGVAALEDVDEVNLVDKVLVMVLQKPAADWTKVRIFIDLD